MYRSILNLVFAMFVMSMSAQTFNGITLGEKNGDHQEIVNVQGWGLYPHQEIVQIGDVNCLVENHFITGGLTYEIRFKFYTMSHSERRKFTKYIKSKLKDDNVRLSMSGNEIYSNIFIITEFKLKVSADSQKLERIINHYTIQ